MKKMFAAMIIALAAPLALFAGEMTVTGMGTVATAADNAYLTVSVVTESTKPSNVLSLNSEATNRIFATLAQLGVKKGEIQSQDLRLVAKYEYPDKQAPKLLGYVATHVLNITVCKVEDTGKVLDAVVKDGANRVDGISFGLSAEKLKEAQKEARKRATLDAIEKADLYAAVLGIKEKELKSFSEYQSSSQPRVSYSHLADRATSTNVESGEIAVRIQVTITWTTK